MTKRKSGEDQTDGGDRNRVAVTAIEESAREASITSDASISTLLSLPLEIRYKIWAAALGDRLIHLKYFERGPKGNIISPLLAHVICKNDCAENQVRERESGIRSGVEIARIVKEGLRRSLRSPHQQCENELDHRAPYRYQRATVSKYQTLHLNTLRVCRQVYHEANTVLWSTNTFSFIDARSLDHFIRTRRSHQVPFLRRLRLQLDWRSRNDSSWESIFDLKLIKLLTGLRSMRLQINQSMKARRYLDLSAHGHQVGLSQSYIPNYVHRLATLPLREVEVFVSDYSLRTPALWTMENRKEYAECIREILLNPKRVRRYI